MTAETKTQGLDSLRRMRHDLRQLLEHPGWDVFRQFVGQKQDGLVRQLVMQPLANLDGALAQEYTKGRYAAMDECQHEPHGWLDTLSLEIAQLEAEEAKEKEPANERREQPKRASGDDPFGSGAFVSNDGNLVVRRSP